MADSHGATADGQAGNAVTGANSVSIVWVGDDWAVSPVIIGASDEYPSDGAARVLRVAPGFSLPESTGPTVQHACCNVAPGTTVAELVQQILTPAGRRLIESGTHGVTVFGRRVRAAYVLAAGDRIELVGPVAADPKADRHRRVADQRQASGRSMWKK
jgi:putative ubiquitin-RnfH superfamily antitoxin RatB of RatAB toxin-antitoxin module